LSWLFISVDVLTDIGGNSIGNRVVSVNISAGLTLESLSWLYLHKYGASYNNEAPEALTLLSKKTIFIIVRPVLAVFYRSYIYSYTTISDRFNHILPYVYYVLILTVQPVTLRMCTVFGYIDYSHLISMYTIFKHFVFGFVDCCLMYAVNNHDPGHRFSNLQTSKEIVQKISK